MIQNPLDTVRDLLSAEWRSANTSVSYDPLFRRGDWDTERETPQITTTALEESPASDSGFSGLDPSGSGPTQRLVGTLAVNCYSSTAVESGVDPGRLTYEFSEEVRRILGASVADATDLDTVVYGGRRGSVDRTPATPLYRYRVPVRFTYRTA